MLASALLSERAKDQKDKVALVCRESGLTFSELDQKATRLASILAKMGITKGDRAGILLPNSIEFGLAYFGVLRAGAVAVIMDSRLKGPELRAIFEDSQLKVLISHSRYLSEVSEASAHRPVELLWFGDPSTPGSLDGDVERATEGAENFPSAAENDEAICLYTSGTTGRPKGVVLTYQNLDHFPETMRMLYGNDRETVGGLILPMSHISGPIYLNEMVARGSRVIVFDQVKPATILEGIEHHRITYIHAVPTIFQLILDYPYISRYDTRSVRLAGMMGTTVPVSLMKRFKKTFPHVTVVQGYGLTETSPFISLTPAKDADRKMASIGKPVPGVEVKLVDNDGREVRTGQEGEIATRGPHVMKGYHRQPEATREKIRDGWFYTGDIGRFDDEGFLYHLGRKDDLVITGGLNVYPAEVENVLRDHPDVRDVVVFGKPDSKRGMLIAAAVIPREGASPDARKIQSYARRHLAGFKVPQSISFRESFPATASGKILRNELAGEQAQSRIADE